MLHRPHIHIICVTFLPDWKKTCIHLTWLGTTIKSCWIFPEKNIMNILPPSRFMRPKPWPNIMPRLICLHLPFGMSGFSICLFWQLAPLREKMERSVNDKKTFTKPLPIIMPRLICLQQTVWHWWVFHLSILTTGTPQRENGGTCKWQKMFYQPCSITVFQKTFVST